MSDDVREALAQVIGENRSWSRRMSDGHVSTGWLTDQEIADAILAAFDVTPKGEEHGHRNGECVPRKEVQIAGGYDPDDPDNLGMKPMRDRHYDFGGSVQ